MKKVFHGYINKYQFFPKFCIYDKFSQKRISEFNKSEATLYLIVKTPKVKFLPESFHVTKNYCIKGFLQVKDRKIEIIFSAAKAWFDSPNIKNRFRNIEEFTDFYMERWRFYDGRTVSNPEKYSLVTTINLEESNENYLRINCALGNSLADMKDGDLILTPYQLISFFEIDCLEDLEIIYIGKSNDDTWKRIYNHNKWGLIEEHREADEDLLVYFMSLDKSSINQKNHDGLTMIIRDESELSVEDATNIMEAALIIYFVKDKKFNLQLVGADISAIETVRKVLLPAGYDRIFVEMDLDGPFGFLGSACINPSRSHNIEYHI